MPRFKLRLRIHSAQKTHKLICSVSKYNPISSITEMVKEELQILEVEYQEWDYYVNGLLLLDRDYISETLQNNQVIDIRPRKVQQRRKKKHLSKRARRKNHLQKQRMPQSTEKIIEEETLNFQTEEHQITQNQINYGSLSNVLQSISSVRLPQSIVQEDLTPFDEESMKNWSIQQNKLLLVLKSIDQVLYTLIVVRSKRSQTFKKICSCVIFNRHINIELTHLKKLLWLDPNIYEINYPNKQLIVKLPRMSNKEQRALRIIKKIQAWKQNNNDLSIPELQLPGAPKYFQMKQVQKEKESNLFDFNPLDVLKQREIGIDFGQRIRQIVRQREKSKKQSQPKFNTQ